MAIKSVSYEDTRNLKKKNTNLRNLNVPNKSLSNPYEMSSLLGTISINNFTALKNIQNNKNISFKGWHLSDHNTIQDEDGMLKIGEPYGYRSADTKKLNEYISTHKGGIIPYEQIELKYSDMYSYPVSKIGSKINGVIYIDYNGELHCYKNDDIKKYENINNLPPDNTKAVIGLTHEGMYEDAVRLINEPIGYCKNTSKKLVEYLVNEGREDEAKEIFPSYSSDRDEKINDINYFYNHEKANHFPLEKSRNDYLAEGDLLSAATFYDEWESDLPEPLNNLTEKELKELDSVIKDEKLLEKKANIKRLKSQFPIPILFLNSANKSIAIQRNLVNYAVMLMIEAKDKQIQERNNIAYKLHSIEQEKEPAKAKLTKYFLTPLKDNNKGLNVVLPNCIMLTGKNAHVLKGLIDWTGEIAEESLQTEYIKLPSRKSREDMHEELYAALENAEENYNITGRRSLIFVNGMEKLLDKNNPTDEIANMKDFMGCADEDFHSTIIFYTTKDPDELAPGTIVSHRVGLKINVPIDIKVKEMNDEN